MKENNKKQNNTEQPGEIKREFFGNVQKKNIDDFKGNRNKYISLTEASQYVPYSQEYLSLRARQGKLQAEKNGRDWMTTINYLNNYLKKINSNDNGLKNEKKISIAFPSKKVLRYSALAIVIFCLSFYPILHWHECKLKIRDGILNLSIATEKNLTNLSKVFKSDYQVKISNFQEGLLATADETKRMGNLIVGSIGSAEKFSVKILSRGRDLSGKFFAVGTDAYFNASEKSAEAITFAFQNSKQGLNSSVNFVRGSSRKILLSGKILIRQNFRQLGEGFAKTEKGAEKNLMFIAREGTRNLFSNLDAGAENLIFAGESGVKTLRAGTAILTSASRSGTENLFSNLDAGAENLIFAARNTGMVLSDGADVAASLGREGASNLFCSLDSGAKILISTTKKGAQTLENGATVLVSMSRSGTENLFSNLDAGAENLIFAVKKAERTLSNGIAVTVSLARGQTENLFSGLDNGSEVLISIGESGVKILRTGATILSSTGRSGTENLIFAGERTQGFIGAGWFSGKNFIARAWNKFSDKLADGYLALLDYLIPERSLAPSTSLASKDIKKSETGVVVFPLVGKAGISQNKYLLAKIEEAFSDEVKIEPAQEDKAGIITPTHPATPDEKYLYMMVPIKDQ